MSEQGFLSQVLKSKEQTLIVDIKETIPVITSKIERLLSDIKSFILGEDLTRHHVNVPNNYLKQVINVNTEMKVLEDNINMASKYEVQKTKLDIQNIECELKKTKCSLKLANSFVSYDAKYKELIKMKKEKDYLAVASILADIRTIIKEIPLEKNLDIVESISTDMFLERSMFLKNVMSIWDRAVKFETKNDKGIETVKIAIDDQTYDLKNIIPALYYEKYVVQFDCLADFLLEKIFFPIINNTVKIVVSTENNHEVLDMRIKTNSPIMHYEVLFDNLSKVFDFLCCKIDYELSPELGLVGYIGDRISDNFCNVLIKNYIENSVPSTEEEFEDYKNIVKSIETLTALLKRNGFLDEQSSLLLANAGKIELLYSNKLSQNYWTKAKIIFKKDLQGMVEVGDAASEENKKCNTFAKCYVSQSTCELLDLLRTIIEHASCSSTVYADKLLHTTKEIIEGYSVLVPTFHKKLLDTVPQQAALFYNNCMYLSYELLNNEQFYGRKMTKDGFAGENFDYQIKYLKTAGTVTYKKIILSQIKHMEEILNDSDLASLSQVEKLNKKCNNNVRRCLSQLEVLQTVWQKILSYEIYNKSIGDLLNSFIEHCIKLVLLAVDISAANSNLLVNMFQVVETQAPTLFSEPKEIHMYTNSWNKFKELIIFLNSSLSSIDDRWADGKGPLAHEFSPVDVRKLIKALFQNTDHRASVLAKIYI